jgi:phosphosulfolactate phosphohydrolase-like enzyme
MALKQGAKNIITGSFPNLSAVCDYLIAQGKPVVLGCSGWKDKFNIEDTMFSDVEDYRASKDLELIKSPAEKLKTMQPMRKRK